MNDEEFQRLIDENKVRQDEKGTWRYTELSDKKPGSYAKIPGWIKPFTRETAALAREQRTDQYRAGMLEGVQALVSNILGRPVDLQEAQSYIAEWLLDSVLHSKREVDPVRALQYLDQARGLIAPAGPAAAPVQVLIYTVKLGRDEIQEYLERASQQFPDKLPLIESQLAEQADADQVILRSPTN